MPDYDGEDRGIPMQGDRSARDALHYPERHTNDINNPTGIHWTKSEIESLIPDVVSENEFDYGIFLASCFRNATLDLWLLWSDNGKAFSQIGSGALYSPGCVRDPSIVSYHGRYYVAHTNVSFGVSTTFSVAVSDDLISWSHVIDVDMTSIVGVAHVWAPEWFIDDDGSLYIFVSCNTNAGDPVGGFKLYEVHPTSEDFLSWSVPAEVTGTGLRSSMVDPFVVKFNGKYHIWYKYSGDEHVEYMSSDNLISDYTITESGDWAGWGSGLEGSSLVRIDYKTWRIYFDKYTEQGIYYSESVDDWANWTAKALITAPFTPAHPTVIQSRDLDLFRDLLNAIGVTPSSHHTTHENGGDDAIKLDDLSAPDNNTDLNASITKHGLMQKYPGGTEDFLRSDGNWAAPAVSGGEILIEDGSSAPPIMLTNEDETDFLYEG
jgi:hypothetical protein